MHHHANTLRGNYSPSVIDAILRSFYVDDLLRSVESEVLAKQLRLDLISALARGGFELTKWRASTPFILGEGAELQEDEIVFDDGEDDKTPTEKVLGVSFSFKSDCFGFKVSPEKAMKKVVTRRQMLSSVASCYDPFGLIAPFLLEPKNILQKAAYIFVNSWDEPLPPDLLEAFEKWQDSILEMAKLKVPRWLSSDKSSGKKPQIHIFVDASTLGYGAVVYHSVLIRL